MDYSFEIHGHENILATHRSTIEFTKDSHLTRNGDCIVGVRAGFSLVGLQKFLALKRVKITIKAGGFTDSFTAIPNKSFGSSHEMVMRIGEFASERTFAVRAEKAARNIDRKVIAFLAGGGRAEVIVSRA